MTDVLHRLKTENSEAAERNPCEPASCALVESKLDDPMSRQRRKDRPTQKGDTENISINADEKPFPTDEQDQIHLEGKKTKNIAEDSRIKKETTVQPKKVEDNNSKSDISQNKVMSGEVQRDGSGKRSSRSTSKQEVINETGPITSHTASNTVLPESLSKSPEESPELTRRMSRTDAVRQDARKLKSVTLGRMGKMFKQRPPTPVRDKSAVDSATKVADNVDNYNDQPSRKEKTNSLGRMFRLVDKDGAPKKLFVQPRAGSLSRILRRHSNNDDSGSIEKTVDDPSRGIFSRMLNQLRGRSASRRPTAEPNVREVRETARSSLPPKAPVPSRTSNPPTSSHSTPSGPPSAGQRTAQIEYLA